MRYRQLLPVLLLPVVYGMTPGCSDEPGDVPLQDPSLFGITYQKLSIDKRALPNATVNVEITATNTGQTTWAQSEVGLKLADTTYFPLTWIHLEGDVAPGASGTFKGALKTPSLIGLFDLPFQAEYLAGTFGKPTDSLRTEVTCSDGLYCNGAERFVAGQCTQGTDPCDDKVACTADTCDEATGTCSNVPNPMDPTCTSCISTCTPDCTGKVCGDDGCGGTCGGGCPMGQACNATNTCQSTNQDGTCAKPLNLITSGTPAVGIYEITGDTTDGINEVVPTCNSLSKSVEKVYTFKLMEKMGIEARVSGYDTVLHIRKEDPNTAESECTTTKPLATVGCSDDASPPGNYGSRVDAALDPGTYYLIIDGFDSKQFGPFDLRVKFTANGCVPHCDGLYCGTDDGCGGDCGTCDAGSQCSDKGRCVPTSCPGGCDGKECGSDECGNSCGTCAAGSLCVPATSTCQVFANCDHEKPVCDPPCGAGKFCGTDCACHQPGDAMPDLVVDQNRLLNEILFDTLDVGEASCAYQEQCVSGPGVRKLLRFSVEAKNQGMATLTVPPPSERPDLFQFSPCHGHYHFSGFAAYQLLDKEGNVLVTGRKQAYCMEDTQQIRFGPEVACDKKYTCDEQGIQAGWSDLYGNTLDCQWLDITDVPAGDYFLEVVLNPGRTFEEISFDNNTAKVPVQIQ